MNHRRIFNHVIINKDCLSKSLKIDCSLAPMYLNILTGDGHNRIFWGQIIHGNKFQGI